MSTDHHTRTLGLQLPLPLPEVEPTTGPVAVPDTPTVGDGCGDDRARTTPGWRLDEHTRRIGRQGVAEARARLRSGSGRAA